MKLQGVSVIFALIVLPLILVLTYYIHLQVDTIEMQKEYDKKLLDSTYGAMSAFEINTANEDLSTVSDSLRTIIDASTNIFMNTLATNFGMSNASKSYLEPYIPAILYTLYDGYYISAPTRTPKFLTDSDGNAVTVGEIGLKKNPATNTYTYTMVHTNEESQNNCTNCILTKDGQGKVTAVRQGSESHVLYETYSTMDERDQAALQIKYDELTNPEDFGQLLYISKNGGTNQYTTNVDEAELEIKHILKTYMPYSARYKNTDVDIVAVYTLDNYLTIEGTIDNVYYTKSGYFIPAGSVNVVEPATSTTDLLKYNQNDAKEYIESGKKVEIKLYSVKNGVAETPEITTIVSDPGDSKSKLEEDLRTLNNKYAFVLSAISQIRRSLTPDISEINNWRIYILWCG